MRHFGLRRVALLVFTIGIPSRLHTRNRIIKIKVGDSGRIGAMLFGDNRDRSRRKGVTNIKRNKREIEEMMGGEECSSE